MIQIWQQPGSVIDILALDYGPGIADLSRAEEDGYSTANTFGKGLGAIRRLSDEAFIYTQQESGDKVRKWSGTVFMARFYAENGKEEEDATDIRLGIVFTFSFRHPLQRRSHLPEKNRQAFVLAASGRFGAWRRGAGQYRQSGCAPVT